MEHEIRRVLRELASEASPVPMVERAVGAGLRLRRRRIGTAATSAAISVVMLLAAGLVLRPGSPPPFEPTPGPSTPPISTTGQPSPSHADDVPTTVITDATHGIALIDGWYAGGNRWYTGGTGRMLLDPYHDEYVEPFPQADPIGARIIPSPDGELALILDPQDVDQHDVDQPVQRQIQVHNFRTGLDLTYPAPKYLLEPHWSPDSSRLLFTTMDWKTDTLSGHVLDLATGTWNEFPLHLPPAERCEYCELTWLPDGQRVGLSIVDDTVGATEADDRPQRGVQLFSLTGEALDLLPIRGRITGDAGSWSPDRSKVVIIGSAKAGGYWRYRMQIVDTATGAIIFDAGSSWDIGADVRWVDNDRLLVPGHASFGGPKVARDGWISLVRVDGTELHRWYVPDDACCLVVHPQQ